MMITLFPFRNNLELVECGKCTEKFVQVEAFPTQQAAEESVELYLNALKEEQQAAALAGRQAMLPFGLIQSYAPSFLRYLQQGSEKK